MYEKLARNVISRKSARVRLQRAGGRLPERALDQARQLAQRLQVPFVLLDFVVDPATLEDLPIGEQLCLAVALSAQMPAHDPHSTYNAWLRIWETP